MNRKGFTLLEMLVATVIMGIAVTGLLSSLTASLRNTARLTEYDRAALIARQKMDEILLLPRVPLGATMNQSIPPEQMGGLEAGWKARVTPFEHGPAVVAGAQILERIELQLWWKAGDQLRHFDLETYRSRTLDAADIAAMEVPQG